MVMGGMGSPLSVGPPSGLVGEIPELGCLLLPLLCPSLPTSIQAKRVIQDGDF